MSPEDFDTHVTSISALGEPQRRALYRFVVAQGKPVGRDAAAAGVHVPRHVAKFHLDRLVEDGLLDVEFRRPPGRTGPGAGRPAKLYRRSARELAVSLPGRRYDIAGEIMARAIDHAIRDDVPVSSTLAATAADLGRSLGETARARAAGPLDDKALLGIAREVMADYGYEPRSEDSCLKLANCPFHALAQNYTELVCGMNLDLLRGLLEGLQAAHLEARLDPAPNRCCVTVCEQ